MASNMVEALQPNPVVALFDTHFSGTHEVYTLEKFHKSMVSGLMVYGMMRAVKK